MSSVRRGSIAALVVAAVLSLQLAPAHAIWSSPDELPEPTNEQLARAVAVWDPARSVKAWDPARSVKPLEQVTSKAGKTTISLASDILFAPDSATMPANAHARLATLIAKVPQGASVNVDGHTDSVKGKVDNKVLSADRAKAVAEVLRKARPDLKLEVAGHGATKPAVTEKRDDPATFAANRRVEISYKN